MILDWPETLPPPVVDAWERRPQEARRRIAAQAGPPRFRRQTSAIARSVTLAVVLSRDELAVFDRFWQVDCAAGALLFRMPDPATDGWPLLAPDGAPLLAPDGSPLLLSARWLCAWGDESPVETMVDDIDFRVSFGLWVLP